MKFKAKRRWYAKLNFNISEDWEKPLTKKRKVRRSARLPRVFFYGKSRPAPVNRFLLKWNPTIPASAFPVGTALSKYPQNAPEFQRYLRKLARAELFAPRVTEEQRIIQSGLELAGEILEMKGATIFPMIAEEHQEVINRWLVKQFGGTGEELTLYCAGQPNPEIFKILGGPEQLPLLKKIEELGYITTVTTLPVPSTSPPQAVDNLISFVQTVMGSIDSKLENIPLENMTVGEFAKFWFENEQAKKIFEYDVKPIDTSDKKVTD